MSYTRYKILFAIDSGYIPHLATALFSLLKNNEFLHFEIFLFISRISVEDDLNLRKICNEYNASLKIIIIDDKTFDGLITFHHFTTSIYFRLLAADFIEGDKCLYLDADIIVNGSIEKLYNKDLDNYYLAAIEDPGFYRHKELGMNLDAKYFNSGVMLINLNKWRKSEIKNLVISFVKNNTSVVLYPDQCGLNSIVNGNWLEISPKYNCQTHMLNNQFYLDIFREINPSIIHFTSFRKPWRFKNKHPYRKLYWFYRNSTSYKSILNFDINFNEILKYISNKLKF